MQIQVAQETVNRYAFYGVKHGDVGTVVCVDRGLLVLHNPKWTTYVRQACESKIDHATQEAAIPTSPRQDSC